MERLVRPKISVVTIVFNGEVYLEGAIRSIARQTFEDYEHIIVDDGSEDGTAAILSDWARKDRRIKVLYQPNSGIPTAYNRGVRAAEGDYVAILDADDLAFPTRLEKQVEYLENHADVGLVGCAELALEVISGRMWVVNHPESDRGIRRSWVHQQVFTHSGTTVRKIIFDQLGYYDEALTIGCDPDLWLRIAERWKLANLPEPLVLRRHHQGQVSNSGGLRTVALNVGMKWNSISRLSLPAYFYFYIAFPLMGAIPGSAKHFLRRSIGHETGLPNSDVSKIIEGLEDLV